MESRKSRTTAGQRERTHTSALSNQTKSLAGLRQGQLEAGGERGTERERERDKERERYIERGRGRDKERKSS